MPKRIRLYDWRLSRAPSTLGLCVSDIVGLSRYANSAQERLMFCREAGQEGWFGTFAEIVFNVSREQPYITLPRQVARLESLNVCDHPIPVQNQFFEYLQFGNGRLPKQFPGCNNSSLITQAMTRNFAPTFVPMSSPPNIVRLYPTDATDIGKRVFVQGLDNNNNEIYTQDLLSRVSGVFLVLEQPFVDAPMQFNTITGIQKDVTNGPVRVMQVNPTTGDEILLSTLEAGEETAWYRRYYLDQLPCGCCASPNSTVACPMVQVRAIAKLEPIPVRVDTDYLVLQNMEALIEEAQAVRYSEMDTIEAKQMSSERHIQAVRFLNGQLSHYFGRDDVAVNFAPFGTARLEHHRIGILM